MDVPGARTSWLRRRPSLGTVLGAVALFVALGGPAEAAKLIDGSRLRKGSVSGAAIKPQTITGRLVRMATITGDRLADRSIALAKLSPATVTTLTATPPNEINGGKVLDRSLSGADLGDETIGQTQIARGGVAGSEISDGSVDGGEIADGHQSVRDLASFAGTATIDPPSLGSHGCWAVTRTAALLWERAGVTIADDAVFVAPPDEMSDALTISARPSGTSSLRLVVCNLSGGSVDSPPLVVRYLTIEF